MWEKTPICRGLLRLFTAWLETVLENQPVLAGKRSKVKSFRQTAIKKHKDKKVERQRENVRIPDRS